MNKIKSNYYEQIRKLSEQRNTVAHRAIGVLSAITKVYVGKETVNIPGATINSMDNFFKDSLKYFIFSIEKILSIVYFFRLLTLAKPIPYADNKEALE